MGICYTYLLYDDFDWGYVSDHRERTIEKIKQELPVATILAHWPHYIVVDLDKNSPWSDNANRLQKYCDHAYYYDDLSSGSIEEMKFKPTEEMREHEANKSSNRNKEYIDQANQEWTERYNAQRSNN